MQPIAQRRGGRGGKSLLGGGKCDAGTATSKRELNLSLRFQNTVQTTGILQFKKEMDLALACAFPFPIPGSHQHAGAALRATSSCSGGTGVFLAIFSPTLKNPGTSVASLGGQLVGQQLLGLTGG